MVLSVLVLLETILNILGWVNSLKALDSKLGFLRLFAGVVQARASRGLKTSDGAEKTGAATVSQPRSANLTIFTILNQVVYTTESCRLMRT
jgi:hypothetical protein